ncbi:Cro/C1-type HTH domain profile [Actinomyces succiniciruminis]|uniref:Cro/C1-type HTH domain profile n=1 Tax=Actinomyces succiniciruminis TaxID=1522002 RepID=A0A1L7RHG7_9ACTO|nr:Cro/C1-type HTH domain profile [Actinomyces succiniciruminis]
MNQLLFENRMTRKELGSYFGVGQSVISRKLRGQVSWTAEELSIMAGLFGMRIDDFAPVRAADGSWIPAQYVAGQQKAPAPAGAGASGVVAGAGFEPATSGL